MTRRITAVLTLLLLPFLLVGATFTGGGYVIVDDDPMFAAPGTSFTTIQAAVDSGATRIDVRPGTYTETVEIATPHVTLNFQGVSIANDGTGVGVRILPTAEYTTIKGEVCIEGNSDGMVLGDRYNGTGFFVEAAHVMLDGICTRALTGFDVVVVAPAHHVTIANCDIQGVATSETVPQLAYYGIYLEGASDNLISDCAVTGKSEGIGLWYGTSRTVIEGVRLTDNWGYAGAGVARSAIEIYSLPGAPGAGNVVRDSFIDGSHGHGVELADVLEDTTVSGNQISGVYHSLWVGGSGTNAATNTTITSNHFYGDGDDGTLWLSGSGRVCGNTWHNWTQNNIGTIFVPGYTVGDITICNNAFNGGGRALRYSAATGALHFTGNMVSGATENPIYIADTTNPNVVIESNTLTGTYARAITQNSGAALTVRNNQLQGGVWGGAESVIEGNTIRATVDTEPTLLIKDGTVLERNRIASDFYPVMVDGTNALIERNYITTLTGGASGLPGCNASNTCVGNWTAGQVPPP